MGPIASCFVQLADLALPKNLFPEVTLVDRLLQNDLIDPLQLGECKLGWQQLIPDRRPFDLVAQSPNGIIKNFMMIEG